MLNTSDGVKACCAEHYWYVLRLEVDELEQELRRRRRAASVAHDDVHRRQVH
jgi:hypothetical protein